MSQPAKKRGPRAIAVPISSGDPITVYAGARVADALEEITDDMTVYKGVRLAQVIDAVYKQGQQDGRRQVVDGFNNMVDTPALAHRNPGRPANKRPSRKAPAKKAAKKTT